MAVLTYLLHLEKVCKKIYSKEYCLVEQSLCELETEETEVAKMGFNLTVVETANILEVEFSVFKACQLSLTNLFTFDLFFFQLPDLLFYNTP